MEGKAIKEGNKWKGGIIELELHSNSLRFLLRIGRSNERNQYWYWTEKF